MASGGDGSVHGGAVATGGFGVVGDAYQTRGGVLKLNVAMAGQGAHRCSGRVSSELLAASGAC